MPPRLIAVAGPPQFVIDALRAAWDDGDAVLPLPDHAPLAADAIQQFGPDVIIDPHGRHDGPATHPELAEPAALVVATSGSTGPPKGVVHTHASLGASTVRSVRQLGAADGDRFGLVLPLHHIAGIQIVLRSWQCNTEPVVLDTVTDALDTPGPPLHISVVGRQLTQLASHVEARQPAGNLGTVLVGGGPVAPNVLADAQQHGWRVVTSYGMTETAGGCVYDGVPFPDVDIDVAAGTIRIRGPVLLHSYLGEDRLPVTDAGWFVTRDRGVFDAQGRLIVLGRDDDVIVTGGENVPAHLVAEALRTLSGVTDAAVVGCNDAEWGAVVCATLVIDVDELVTLADVQDHVRRQLPEAFVPRRLQIVPTIPTTTLGKPDTSALRALFENP